LLSHGTFNANLAPQFWVDVFNSLPRGEDGVRIFFCLSGFLITHLLLKEEYTYGRISLKSFYARRAMRILPVYFAYIAAVALLNVIFYWGVEWKSFVAPMTFTTGLWLRRYDVWVFMHFWTLSVEEIFYLFWPLFLLLAPKRWRVGLVVCSLACLPAIRVAGSYTAMQSQFTSKGLVLSVDYLLMGCLFALFFRGLSSKSVEWPGWSLSAVKWTAFVLFLAVWFVLQHGGMLGLSGEFVRVARLGPGTTLMAFAITLLIVATALTPDSLLTRLLSIRPLVGLGVISYGAYVWHQLFINPFAEKPLIWQKFPLNICIAVCVGWLSYALYEKRFLKYKERFLRARQCEGSHSAP